MIIKKRPCDTQTRNKQLFFINPIIFYNTFKYMFRAGIDLCITTTSQRQIDKLQNGLRIYEIVSKMYK